MSMDLRDNKKKHSELRRLMASFKYAIEGFWHIVKNERNMRIHLTITVFVLFLSYFFSISKVELMVIIFLIGMVISLEAVNTAIERTVDLVTKERQPLAKQAKDASAAAVFVFSIISVIIGGLIFYSPFLRWIDKII